MSLLDSFFDTKITDSKSKINYNPPDFERKIIKRVGNDINKASKSIIKNTNDIIKNIYDGHILWCKSFYKTDIYFKCTNEIVKQIYSCVGVELGNVLDFIDLPFSNEYWFGDIQKRYNSQQLKRVEKELASGKTSEELCYEMLYFVWKKIRPREDDDYLLTEYDVFKIKNRANGGQNGK